MPIPWLGVVPLAARLIVETGSPDAFCPDLASTEAAISARLGRLESEGAARWRLRYTIGHAPNAASGDFVRVELYDPDGTLRLSRDLPLAGESCVTMARVIALVIDRFFRTMVAEQQEEADHSLARPSPPTNPNAEKTDETEPVPPTGERNEQQLLSLWALQAGIMAPPALPVVGLEFLTQATSGLSLGSSVTWVILPQVEELGGGAQAELRSVVLRFSLAANFPFGGGHVGLGPTVGYGAEWGTTSGLEDSSVKYRSVVAGGATAFLLLPVGSNTAFELSGVLEAPFRPFGGTFRVDDREVLAPPVIRGWLTVGFGPAWFR